MVDTVDLKTLMDLKSEARHLPVLPRQWHNNGDRRMTFIKALELLLHNYNYASKCDWIYNPVAWALYETWKKADKDGVRHNEEDKD